MVFFFETEWGFACHISCRVWHKNYQHIDYFAGFVQKKLGKWIIVTFPSPTRDPTILSSTFVVVWSFLDNIAMKTFLISSHFSLHWDPSFWGWASYTKFFDNIIFFGQYCNKKISDFFTFLSEVRSLLVRLGKGSRQMGATASQSTKLRKIFNLCWNIWERKIWKDENILEIGVEMHQIVQSWTIGRF